MLLNQTKRQTRNLEKMNKNTKIEIICIRFHKTFNFIKEKHLQSKTESFEVRISRRALPYALSGKKVIEENKKIEEKSQKLNKKLKK